MIELYSFEICSQLVETVKPFADSKLSYNLSMNQKRLILASTSPRRKELLESTSFAFEIIGSEYEEDMTLPMEAKDLVMFLSKGKAEVVAKLHPDAVVIGADTFIVFNGKVLGKPHTPERAEEMLKELRGSKVSILSGFTVIEKSTGVSVSDVDESFVYFKDYTDEDILKYIETGEPLDRAGAFAIQGIGKILIDRFEGDIEGAMGLPLKKLVPILHNFGIFPNLQESN